MIDKIKCSMIDVPSESWNTSGTIRPIMTREKRVTDDHGEPPGTTSRISPGIKPALKAARHCRLSLSSGSKGRGGSKSRIMRVQLFFCPYRCKTLGQFLP